MSSKHLTRRELIAGGAKCATLGAIAASAPATAQIATRVSVARIAPSADDRVIVPAGYTANVVVRWGDALFAGAPSLDPNSVVTGGLLEPSAAREQGRQFGANCDGMGVIELDDGRTVVCVNHEYPIPQLMFPGWAQARRARELGAFVRAHPSCVAYMQSSVGLSVMELDRRDGWRVVLDSKLNRRVTAGTRIEISGPASGHVLLDGSASCLGTLGNCAAGTTPWGTYLTAEENIDDFFGNGRNAEFSREAARAHTRFGFRQADSAHRWEYADARFDLARNPHEPFRFGWITELDPLDPARPIRKRTALGRFKHEGATTTLSSDGRVAVYMGDDEAFEYLYKFVSADTFDPDDPRANLDLLDSGTLFVARLNADGSGEWLPLVWAPSGELSPANGFASQADVVLCCREAADRLGATPLDRPEDVAVNPITHRVYLSCTQNLSRGAERNEFAGRRIDSGPDAANPRVANRFGHVLEFVEEGNDAAARRFEWQIFLMAGAPSIASLETDLRHLAERGLPPEATYFGGFAKLGELSAFSNPDNLTFDHRGNLWIVTDGAQPLGNNNGCFVCPTAGENRGRVAQFMSGPIGAEICGCEITADDRTLFLTVQHPGEPGSLAAPVSHWPDGGTAVARSSLLAIEPGGSDARLGDSVERNA